MSAKRIRVPVFPSTRIRSFPLHESGGPARYTPIALALSRTFETDAHFAAYAAPECPRRLSKDAVTHLTGIEMVAFVVDVDDAHAHAAGLEAGDDWFRLERAKLRHVLKRLPDGFVYRTRGGYRIVYVRPPFTIGTADDGERWKRWYVSQLAYLGTTFDVWGDPACRDWTRLYRLPHVTREPESDVEDRELIGNPERVGVWNEDHDRPDLRVVARIAEHHDGWRSALRLLRPSSEGSSLSPVASRGDRIRASVDEAFPLRRGRRGVLHRAVARIRRSTHERNNLLNKEAFIVGRLVATGRLDHDAASHALLAAASACGLLEEDARQTIFSAFNAARRRHG